MNNYILFTDNCFIKNDHLYFFGQYFEESLKPTSIVFNSKNTWNDCSIVHLEYHPLRLDFCVKIPVNLIDLNNKVSFLIKTVSNQFLFENVNLLLPFDSRFDFLNKESNICVTICRHYGHRLKEWIKYNLEIGFDAIVIFDNNANSCEGINEITINQPNATEELASTIKDFKNNVIHINYPYSPFEGNHWSNIQRIFLHIASSALKDKCNFISFLDPDEFIFFPQSDLKEFLSKYNQTICIHSKILTNKGDNDVINNNVLDIARYSKAHVNGCYDKILFKTNSHNFAYEGTEEVIFQPNPHHHPHCVKVDFDSAFYYHTWLNERFAFNEDMEKVDDLFTFKKKYEN